MNKKIVRFLTLVAVLALTFSLVLSTAAQPAAVKGGNGGEIAKSPNGVYIIQMIDAPVVAYEGGVNGLRATKPGKGQKIDPNSAAVRRYKAFLNGKHDSALDAVGAKDNKIYSYGYSFNGFAAILTEAQAKTLAARSDVLNIWADELPRLEPTTAPISSG